MAEGERITIPARKGKAAILRRGERVRVINIHGSQVVDTWAFSLRDPREFMSMEHTRTHLLRLFPKSGDSFVTNRRRPILTLVEDTSPGIHDTVLAACDRYRYEQLGCKGHHDSCTDNLAASLAELGMTPPETPSPLNLFMNIPVGSDGGLSFEPALSKPGDYVTLRAEMDCVVAFSACPQDIVPINGAACTPMDAQFQILP
ncbi:MAG TPA: urea carboxylase-associated family protein [Alphaproteobacteria bacterium]|nr:urea carboxylase-associated family protein [Alphaproteobacteria bacterium]